MLEVSPEQHLVVWIAQHSESHASLVSASESAILQQMLAIMAT